MEPVIHPGSHASRGSGDGSGLGSHTWILPTFPVTPIPLRQRSAHIPKVWGKAGKAIQERPGRIPGWKKTWDSRTWPCPWNDPESLFQAKSWDSGRKWGSWEVKLVFMDPLGYSHGKSFRRCSQFSRKTLECWNGWRGNVWVPQGKLEP